jgi:hypothetical protein
MHNAFQTIGPSYRPSRCAVDRSFVGRATRRALVAAALALGVGFPAFGQKPDLWQTYMSAAASANSDDDFETQAVLLRRALDYARSHDAKGPRLTLAVIPAMLAYIELDKEQLAKAINPGELRLDLSTVDESLKQFIYTLRRFGSTYDDRWKKRIDVKEDADKETERQSGAESLLNAEVAFRKKLLPEDADGLAEAQALLGMAVARRNPGDSQKPLSEAMENFRVAQQRRSAMDAITRHHFDVADAGTGGSSADVGTNLKSSQLYAMVIALQYVIRTARDSLDEKKFDVFQSQIDLATELHAEVSRATSRMGLSWPRSPTFGVLARSLGELYATEYQMTKIGPKEYPESFTLANDAFERAVTIYAYTHGPTSDNVRYVVSEYADFLRAADRNDEAARLEERYRIEPPR